jgi:OOP family OmpA-OmpF porin
MRGQERINKRSPDRIATGSQTEMKRLLVAVSMAGALFVSPGAPAAERDGAWYITPGVYGLWTDDQRNADDDYGASLAIGKAISEHWNLELDGRRSEHEGVAGDDLVLNAAGLNALLVFYRDSRISPFLLLGAGWQENNPEISANQSDAYADTGVGILFNLNRSSDCSRGFALRGDLRARHDFAGPGNDRLVDYIAGLGLHFYWGGDPCLAEPEPEPEAVPPPPPPAPADSDGDGVTDDKDRCPGTAAGAAVDESGCELDGDGDGVGDRLDKCPNTRRGDKVDANGCPFTLTLEVQFDNNSATLRPESLSYLDQVAARLNELTLITGVIEGHTDSNGSAEYNQDLSERRAKTVRDYLVSKGVAGSRLTAEGLGETRPVADNTTADGRAQNRRVVLRRTDQT